MIDQTTEERFHFNNVADLYDSARPDYPSLLADDLICLLKIPPDASILDVGCGTGKSTELFAKRGYSVYALDPGIHMLELCKRNLHAYASIRYEIGSFESWSWSGRPFDLIVSGTAFHWVPEAAHKQLTALLQPKGALAIFWHTFLSGSDPVHGTIQELYKKHSPENYDKDFHMAQEVFDRKREQQVLSIAGFGQWRTIRYYDDLLYGAKRYVELMRTWSTHRYVNEILFSEVKSAIDAAGGSITKPIRTTLCFAQRHLT